MGGLALLDLRNLVVVFDSFGWWFMVFTLLFGCCLLVICLCLLRILGCWLLCYACYLLWLIVLYIVSITVVCVLRVGLF